MKKLTQLLKESQHLDYRRMNVGEEDGQGMTKEEKRAFVEAVAAYRQLGEMISHKGNLAEIHESIKGIVESANNITLKETGDWFDRVTVQRHMKSMNESFKVFSSTLKEVSTLQQRLESTYDEIGEVLGKYYEIKEGNEFGAERAKAIAGGEDSFEVDGKSYKVTGVDAEDKKNAEDFANESMKLTSLIKRNEELTGRQKELDVDSDGDIEADDLADLRAGKKADESVNEGVSPADMDKIKGAVEAASSFMSVGSELKKLGMKYTFATEPLPIYIIQPTPNNKVAVVNKKYATKPDFVVGDIAVGIMEGKLNEEEMIGMLTEADKITNAVDDMLEKWMLELGEPHPNAPNRSYYSFFETKPAQGWWTRGDGARYKQPPFIAPSKSSMPLKDRLKDKSSSIKNETDLMNWLWKKISSLSGAKKLNVSGEFGDGAEAIQVGGKLFVRQKNNPRAINYSTTSILRNVGVWNINEEEIKWDVVQNVIINFLKMNTKILDKRVQAKDTNGVKGGLKSIISGLVNAQRNLKLESVNEAGYTVKAKNPYQFVTGAYAVLSAYLRDEELGPKGKRELQDIIKSLDYMRMYFYANMTESAESVNEASTNWETHFKGFNEKELKVIQKFILMNPKGIDGVIEMSKKKDFKPFIQKAAKRGLGESKVNEEKYTVIDPMGNQKGVGPKIQAISMAKRLGGEKTGHFVVANTNALKARRALEKFKGDFKNPKLKDMMMNLYYESVNERIVKEKVK